MSTNEEYDAAMVASLAAEIASERAYRDMTQEEVYDRAGISRSAYLKIENGQPGVKRTMDQIARIAHALDMSLSELMSRVDEGTPLFVGALSKISDAQREELRQVRGELRPESAPKRRPNLRRIPRRETGT